MCEQVGFLKPLAASCLILGDAASNAIEVAVKPIEEIEFHVLRDIIRETFVRNYDNIRLITKSTELHLVPWK